jgi:hypothetical protein
MVKKTTKMLKKLNKSGIKFDGKKKKFFTSSKRKPISEMDCYNCDELGHLAHQCPKPPKDKYKNKNKGKKDDSSDEKDDKKKKPYKKKDGKKKEYHKKKKGGKAYIVGDWLTDIESSCESSGDESDDEKENVAAFVIGPSLSSSTSSLPSSPPSSTTHLCLMAKGERKVQNDSDDDDDSDSDDEYEAPSYDELVKLLNKYTKVIRKTRKENDELQNENESLSSKLEIAQKTSDELRDQNKIVSSTLKELKTSNKELRDEHDKLEKKHNELNTRYNLLKDDYTSLKVNYDSLVVANELSLETHDATNQIVKIDIATSCDDLIDESIEQGSSSKGKKVVESDCFDDYAKLKSEIEKLKQDLENATTTNTVVIENLDHDQKLVDEIEELKKENNKLKAFMTQEKQVPNELLIEENKKLKKEKEHLKVGLSKFTRGQYLQSELLMNTVMKMDRSGIGYVEHQEKKIKAQQKQQDKPKPKPKRCFECRQEGHFSHECVTPPPQPLPKHARPFAFNAHYMLRKDPSGKIKVMFLGPPNKNRPKKI